jgi:hypothetical protein
MLSRVALPILQAVKLIQQKDRQVFFGFDCHFIKVAEILDRGHVELKIHAHINQGLGPSLLFIALILLFLSLIFRFQNASA